MANLTVVCPKCGKRQELSSGAAIPAEGMRHVCVQCQSPFLIRPPRAAASGPPQVPAAGRPLGAPPPIDLPAPRESVPRPDDLVAPREAMPRPDDLLAPREAMPRPDDLLAPRESMPRPDDVLAPRESMPRPDDVLAPRESMPRPDDVLAPRFDPPGNPPGTRTPPPKATVLGAVKLAQAAFPASSIPGSGGANSNVGLDLFLGDIPTAARSPLEPLDLEIGLSNPSGAALDLDLALGAPAPRPAAPGIAGGVLPLDLLDEPLDFLGGSLPPGAAPLPKRGAPLPPPLPPASLPQRPPAVPAARAMGAAVRAPSGGEPEPEAAADFGFSLELEESPPAHGADISARPTIPLPSPGRPGAGGSPAQELLPTLEPPRRREGAEIKAKGQRISRRHLMILGGVAGTIALAMVVFALLILPGMHRGPKVADVMNPFAAEVARDQYPAYGHAADQLADAAVGHPDAYELRGEAARLWLLAYLAHGGDKNKLSRAEQLLGEIPSEAPAHPHINEARALLAVAKGKGNDVDSLLGANLNSPGGQLVVGLRRLGEGKAEPAVEAFHKFVEGQPDQIVGLYLRGLAQELAKRPEGKSSFQAALAKNPGHFGASLGRIRLGDPAGPAPQIAALRALLEASAKAGPGEVAQAHVLLGKASLSLGHVQDAVAAFTKALAIESGNPAASVALAEIYLADGRYAEALARLRAAGPGATKIAAFQFGQGGALVATGKLAEGMALLQRGMQEFPDDPRGPYWQAFLADTRVPPDLEGAVGQYRQALAHDPKFLPASLRLAALLQRQGHPQEALKVLREAEQAGAPASALQMAWGEALIVAKEPQRAEDVFRQSLIANPKLPAAHLGLAAALEAQGKREDAKSALEKSVALLPDSPEVRERLAEVLTGMGFKDEALTQYQTLLASGKARPSTRVGLAQLALDMGRLDVASTELEKVIADNPETAGALFTMARVREAQGDLSHALTEYRRALAFEGGPDLHLAYGKLLVKLGKEDDALGALDLASGMAEGRLEKGRIFFKKGDLERALTELTEAVKMNPALSEGFLMLGACHDKLGERAKAAASWRAAIKADPESAEAHYHLGRMEMDEGHPAAALPHLRQAVSKALPKVAWESDVYYQLGYAELGSGTKPNAAVALRKYLDLAPSDAPARPDVERALEKVGGR